MHKSTDSASLAHMAAPWFGERTPQELLAALLPFRGLCNEYRRRFEEDGIALTQDEAVEAYKLVAPLYAPDMTDEKEEAALQAAMNAIACRLESGEIVFRGPAVEAILEGFERMIAKGSQTLYIRHHGEAEAREKDSWTKFVYYKALKYFVDVLSDDRSRIRIIDEPPRALERAQAILANKLTVTRPRGRYDPTLTLRRNAYIVHMLAKLSGCGLPVTSRRGDSLAGALADVLGMNKRTIRDVWEEDLSRSRQFIDARPPDLRGILAECTGFIRHSRKAAADAAADAPPDPALPNIIPDVQCAKCGKAGKVPMYRTLEGGSGLCTDCREW